MSYYIPAGTWVTIQRPEAEPHDWKRYQTKKDLRFLRPVSSTRGSYVFTHRKWKICVRKNQFEHRVNARSA